MRRVFAGLLVATVFAISGCTADKKAPAVDDVAAQSGPRCIDPAPSAAASPGAGPVLPAMVLRCFAGGRWTSVADLGGAPTIVNLWASWCGPCRTELPAFQRLVTAAGGKVRVVGVVTKDTHAAAQSVIDEQHLTFPMLEDGDQQFAVAAGQAVSRPLANALPATLFVAPGGRIVYAYQGPALDDAKIRALTAEHLGIEVPQ